MAMEKPTTLAVEEQQLDEAAAALVKKISGLAAAIGKLPSLSPTPEVNSLFTELVNTCIPASTVDVAVLGPEVQAMREALIRRCSEAEGLLEAHYADLLAGFDNPLDHLHLFPYFGNYVALSKLDSLVLAAHHLPPTARVHNYDICPDANARAERLVRADPALAARVAFVTADVADVTRDMAAYDVVFLAALVGMAAEEKAQVVAHLGRHMAPGAALVVRSAHGARAFMYPVVDPEEVRRGGFDVLAVHHPVGEIINSVIIARKPPPAVVIPPAAASVPSSTCKGEEGGVVVSEEGGGAAAIVVGPARENGRSNGI
ncbi:hypothetical protein PR202_gb28872 [Eleusine coracana subsp. coracana]|uniref:Nicotianamine synthase n=1 Tax=Eleusine coracana subsp. coracana TaxID=191504 RepID=A0AAV5FZZ2_ELECO|nr:hypothetical protein PR202_gb28872 [Eleusine coracana subsp. coracana]